MHKGRGMLKNNRFLPKGKISLELKEEDEALNIVSHTGKN